jgi:glycosyltransferase involved in cell wall biosynthesis
MHTKKKILWLCSWYPNRLEPFNGDFIQRHAEAVSKFEDIHVIHLVHDKEGTITRKVWQEEICRENYSETIIYYYVNPSFFFGKISARLRYIFILRETLRQYFQKNGFPNLVHVHVGMPAGVIALWIKRKWKISFVLTEHWSGFLENAMEKFSQLSFYTRYAWNKVAGKAASVSFVSGCLLNSYLKIIPVTNERVIPNVVNTDLFKPGTLSTDGLQFIHVSGMDENKNTTLIIEAFGMLQKKFPQAKLVMIGATKNTDPLVKQKASAVKNIEILPEMPQQELVKYLQQSLALILYSGYETFGCVVIEANACGIPVIVSDIPVFHETVKEGVNGYFAQPANAVSLAERMEDIIKNRTDFNNQSVSQTTASRFGYEAVGRQFSNWYGDVLKKN